MLWQSLSYHSWYGSEIKLSFTAPGQGQLPAGYEGSAVQECTGRTSAAEPRTFALLLMLTQSRHETPCDVRISCLQDAALAAAGWHGNRHSQRPPGGRPWERWFQCGLLCPYQGGRILHSAACRAVLHIPAKAEVTPDPSLPCLRCITVEPL